MKETCSKCGVTRRKGRPEANYELPFTQAELAQKAAVPGTTAIIATCQSEPRMFALSLLSLLNNSSIRSVIVYINGSWEDTAKGDQKQQFCAKLREQFPVCLRVMRVWGHVGHAECVDGAISWCHTENMLLMHDDTVVLDNIWESKIPFLDKPGVAAIVHTPAYCMNHVCSRIRNGKPHTEFPHMNACFLMAKKATLLPWRWQGWHVELPDQSIGYDMGVWLLYNVLKSGMKVVEISGHVFHLAGLSTKEILTDRNKSQLRMAERLASHKFSPELTEIYKSFAELPLY